MRVLDMKEQSLELKNIDQNESALKYWESMWLKIKSKKIYSIRWKRHKIKAKYSNGGYCFFYL